MQQQNFNLKYLLNYLEKSSIAYKTLPLTENQLEEIDDYLLSIINDVFSIAKRELYHIGIVGGFVRDILLKRKSYDVDFVVFQGDMNKITNLVAKKFNTTVARMSNKTLTSQIRIGKHIILDFTSARKEEYSFPSRLPFIEKGTIYEDLKRRDFTINTLVLVDNNIVDVFGGIEDINNKLLRATSEPDIVFKEDYLRMFRALRFSITLQFDIEDETREGINRNAKNLPLVPKDRIINELNLAFSQNPSKTFDLMCSLNLFSYLYPEINLDKGKGESYKTKTVKETIKKILEYLEIKGSFDPIDCFCTFFRELEFLKNIDEEEKTIVPQLKQFLKIHRFSRKEINQIIIILTYLPKFFNEINDSAKKSNLRYFIYCTHPYTHNIISLALAENNLKKKPQSLDNIRNKIIELLNNKEKIFFTLAVNGTVLNKKFNIEGKEIEKVKKLLLKAVMNEEIENTEEQCLKYLKEHLLL